MARTSMQKQKLLCLRQILLEKTDEKNGLTIAEIIDELKSYGIESERKSLYDDLKILEMYGLDICCAKSSTVRYYVGSREFEMPELKLLVDAIQSSKFITHKKSLSLIKKLEGLVSIHEGKQLQRQVYVANRIKAVNEKIYYNVDNIHNAIADDKQISFKYFSWELDFSSPEKIVKKLRRDGAEYRVSPWALCWDDENYYMIAYDRAVKMIKHYRVDKMDAITVCGEERDGKQIFNKFDLAGYSKGVFSMFGGEQVSVTLSVANEMIGVIVDRFGKEIFVSRENEERFCVTVNVMLSPQFYAWVFGLGGKIKILSPQKAVHEFKDQLRKASKGV